MWAFEGSGRWLRLIFAKTVRSTAKLALSFKFLG